MQTSSSDLVASMRSTINDMIRTGTCAFVDFREVGSGVRALKKLRTVSASCQSFGRPLDNDISYLDSCDGPVLAAPATLK